MARGRLSRRHRHHQAAAGALARPRGARGPPLLLLPARSHRDADLAHRSARGRASGSTSPATAAPFARCAQDGDRLRQDHRDGDADRLAGAQQGHLPAGQAFLEERARRRAGPDGRSRLAGAVPRHRATTTTSSTSSRRRCCDKLRQGKVLVRNWHKLDWETEEQIAQEAQRGQARSQERRGLRPRGAGRDGQRTEHPRHQRRGPPRLARAGRSRRSRASPRTKSKRPPNGSAASTASTARAASSLPTTSPRRRSSRRARRAPRKRCSAGS